MYTDVNVNISDSQKQKVKKALAAGTQFSLRPSHEDLVGNDVIAVVRNCRNQNGSSIMTSSYDVIMTSSYE